MRPMGRTSPERVRGTVAKVRIPDSITTVGRGRMLTPAAMPMACLMVSTLSNSITTSTFTPCCFSARSMALRTARSIEGHELLSREISRLHVLAPGEAMAGMDDEHHGLGAKRKHVEGARRRGIGEDAHVRLVVE